MKNKLLCAMADAIETRPSDYRQRHWCTCLAFHAARLAGWTGKSDTDMAEFAREALGISKEKAAWLFNPSWRPSEGRTVAEELRFLAENPNAWGRL